MSDNWPVFTDLFYLSHGLSVLNPIIDTIRQRASSPKLTFPAPSEAERKAIFECAMRAPDHARLKPWRFHVIEGQDLVSLGEVFESAASAGGAVAEDKLEKCRNMPLRAPLMIVAVCEPIATPKVPVTDQLLAVGAAVQNMQLAISSLGYGSIWRTGEMAKSELVKNAFEVSEQGEIVAFLYVGTPERPMTAPETPFEQYVTKWEFNR